MHELQKTIAAIGPIRSYSAPMQLLACSLAGLLSCGSPSAPSDDSGAGGSSDGDGDGGRSATGGRDSSTSAGGTTGSGGGSGEQSLSTGGQSPDAAGGSNACGAACALASTGDCSAPDVRITNVLLGRTVLYNESETELAPLVLGAAPTGGARLGFMSDNGELQLAQLSCQDELVGELLTLPAHDFQDIAADESGTVAVLTRDARGGGTLNCGEPANLCDGGPDPAVACHEMWMVRHDCAGSVVWEAPLTTASPTLPPYSTGPEGPMSLMIWWYQHHGRLAYDGQNYAAYFGVAISISENACINIHQGDRMVVVGPDGTPLEHPDDFGSWGVGCSHSWNTRIVWDDAAGHFIMVCATDNEGRVAQPDPYRTIYVPADLATLSVGDLVLAEGGGYWVTASDGGTVHLLHFSDGLADQDLEIAQSNFSHLVSYGQHHMIAAWEENDQLVARVLSRSDGSAVSEVFELGVPDNRYQWFEAMADGSVAYAAPGLDDESVRIARILPCE